MKLIEQLKKNWFIFLLIIAIAFLLIVPDAKIFLLRGLIKTGLYNANTKKENIKIPKPENIFFVDETGIQKSLEDLKGKVVFINFWATWCPPCAAEMPTINALYNKMKNDNHFIFIMVDADNDFKRSLPFMQSHHYNFPVYNFNGNIPQTIYSGTLPQTIIINAEGNIVQRHAGIANYDTQSMIDFLHSL